MRLQNALTKQLTDEHERVDLQLREKVRYIIVLKIWHLTHAYEKILGRGSQKDQKEQRRDWCLVVWGPAPVG